MFQIKFRIKTFLRDFIIKATSHNLPPNNCTLEWHFTVSVIWMARNFIYILLDFKSCSRWASNQCSYIFQATCSLHGDSILLSTERSLSNALTAWCRVLLGKPKGPQRVKKFPSFHGTRRFITALTSVRHMSLSWASPIQSIYPHSTSCRSILILFVSRASIQHVSVS